MRKLPILFLTISLFLVTGNRTLWAQNGGNQPAVKYVVKKGGAKVPVVQLLQELNHQFGGRKIIVPHPSVLTTRPINFHSTMELSYPELRAILSVNGIELVESKVNGREVITAYSAQSIPSLRTGSTPFFDPDQELPEGRLVVTQAFRIKHVDPNTIYALLRSMIFQDPKRVGNVFYVRGAGAIVIRDFRSNVDYYAKLIRSLDLESEQSKVEVVKLQNASAEEVAQVATRIVQADAGAKRGAKAAQGGVQAQVIGDKRTNKVIVFAEASEMKKYLKLIRELDEKVPEGSSGKFHVIKIEHVKAEDLGPKLNELLTGQTNQINNTPGNRANPAKQKVETRIIAAEKSNSLLIQAEQAEFRKIQELVKKLDKPSPQVLIESHIFEVESSRSLNIGTEIATVDPSVPDSIRGAGLTNFGLSQIVIDPNNPNNISRIPNANQGVLAALHKGGFDRLPLIFNLLGTDRTTNIVAEPFAVTNNNEKATFSDQTEIPTVSRTSTGADVNFVTQQGSVTATTELTITPSISPGDYLRLEIDLKIEDFTAEASPGSNTTPPKTSRSYKGSVTVKNGRYIIIGGLTRNDFTETKSKVPILGDIPVLGWLFSNTSSTKRKVNIYIFIRAYILRQDRDPERSQEVTDYWKKKAEESSGFNFREDYARVTPKSRVLRDIENDLIGPRDNLLTR